MPLSCVSKICVIHTIVEGAPAELGGMTSAWSGPLGAYPRAGRFVMTSWRFTDEISPEDFASEAEGWVVLGARVLRACCGIGPEHVRALR